MATLVASRSDASDLKPWVTRLVRVGYAAKGIIYVLIGTLAFRLALGDGGRLTDSSGALTMIVEQPFGFALLAIVATGILSYAAWEMTQAVLATTRPGTKASGLMTRGLSIVKGVVYGAIGVEAMQMLVGARAASRGADDYARTAMSLPFGGVLLALIGMGIALYGLKQIWMAWHSQFDDDLNVHHLRREGGGWAVNIGRAGIGARGVILVLVGAAVARAGFDQQPSEARGMTEAMWTLFAQPYGQWLLAGVAAGLTCFGIFQMLHARYARL